jgi:hypothetical protein
MMASPFIWTMPELSKIDDSIFFFFLFYLLSVCPNTCVVRFVLLQYDYCAHSSSKWERTNDIERKGKKKEEESQQQNRVQLTGQILEPMKQVCVRVYAFFRFLSRSLFLFHAYARAMFVFLFYSTPREQCV